MGMPRPVHRVGAAVRPGGTPGAGVEVEQDFSPDARLAVAGQRADLLRMRKFADFGEAAQRRGRIGRGVEFARPRRTRQQPAEFVEVPETVALRGFVAEKFTAEQQPLGRHHRHIVVAAVELEVGLRGSGVGAEDQPGVKFEDFARLRGGQRRELAQQCRTAGGQEDVEIPPVGHLRHLVGPGARGAEIASDHPVGQRDIGFVAAVEGRGDPEHLAPRRIELRNLPGTVRVDDLADPSPGQLLEQRAPPRDLIGMVQFHKFGFSFA